MTSQVMLPPLARLATPGHVTLPLPGKPLTTQVALAAAEGPPLVQVAVPFTVAPALASPGNPLAAACMSAEGVTVVVALAESLPAVGSLVLEAAFTVMVTDPLAGTV